MSSDYHLLCVAHDPVIVIDGGWQHAAEALAALGDRSAHDLLRQHPTCDLLIGRYSAPLIEVCCPGGSRHSDGRVRLHTDERWIDVGWLRLLYHAFRSTDPAVVHAAHPLGDCWSVARLLRLRHELQIEPSGDDG